ncbi:hypothetical protein CFAM422_002876 [Trichoderma lentiforme]|uniref:Uncharacterized protein n=1 Tax=Trichoderma lentiforme TaxID=1567552 RepID=A0A9P5CEP5_9HYPO|nr:hypothetical protein CFAM422_002876 [Trichoderma lentiforme]
MAQRPCLDFLPRELVASAADDAWFKHQSIGLFICCLLPASLLARHRSVAVISLYLCRADTGSVDHHQQAQGFERPSRTDRSSQRAVPELFLCNNQAAKLCLRRIRSDRGHT